MCELQFSTHNFYCSKYALGEYTLPVKVSKPKTGGHLSPQRARRSAAAKLSVPPVHTPNSIQFPKYVMNHELKLSMLGNLTWCLFRLVARPPERPQI